MSFAQTVKDELCRVPTQKKCCLTAEFSAFLLFNGSIRIDSRQGVSLAMTTEHSGAARRIFSLAKEVYRLETQILVHRKNKLRKNQVYSLQIPAQDGVKKVLSALGFPVDEIWRVDMSFRPPEQIWENQCCKRAFLRGAFLANGSINNPKGSYHLEIICNSYSQVQFLNELLTDFEISGKSVKRKDSWVFYVKESEQIVTFLNIIGSHGALLEFENIRIEKEMRNHVNRLVNSEAANIEKQVTAAQKQLEDINKIAATVGIASLPKSLQATAEARLSHPELSLSGLAELLGLGKSGVNHRLRRLAELAEELGGQAPSKTDAVKSKAGKSRAGKIKNR